MFHRFAHRIIGPIVVAWLLLTIAGMATRAVVWNRFSRNLETSSEAEHLSDALNKLLFALQDAETGQRGFLLTVNADYLEPFKHAEDSIEGDFAVLAAQMTEDRAMQNDLLQLRALTALKLSEMRETIRLRKEKNLNAALAVMNNNKGRQYMEEIRKLIGQMRQRRQLVLADTWDQTRQYGIWTQYIGLSIGVLGLGAGVLALYLVQISYVREREQRQLLEDKLRAEKSVMEKSAFLANMSHEIRTPMNAILGFGELLADEKLTPKQTQYVRSIYNSGTALLQLINDVLDMSKLEAGKLELHLEPTDLREAFDFLRTMFSQQAVTKSLKLNFEIDENLPHALLIDRLRFRQVLVNLVGNAMKFTLQGHVRVVAHWKPRDADPSRGTLLVDVEDSGVGIAPALQAEIFKPFVQGNSRRDLENQGTGLGLSIVQRLVQMMSGVVTLESKPSVGSVFRLTFEEVAISARLPVHDLEELDGKVDFDDFAPTVILVVDDNATNRQLMTGLFENTQHELRLAANGQEAMASIQEKAPQIVLMDIRMPVMDGQTTLQEIRKQKGMEVLPVIAVTASGQPQDEKELRHRFSGYIRKPFSRSTLYQELALFLPRPAAPGVVVTESISAFESAPVASMDREALTNELRRLRDEVWPVLRDSLAINQTLAFAAKLRELNGVTPGSRLGAYADRLTGFAETYSVTDLQKCLDEFPALIAEFEKSR